MYTLENNKTKSISSKQILWFGDEKYPDISTVRHYFEPLVQQSMPPQSPYNNHQPSDNDGSNILIPHHSNDPCDLDNPDDSNDSDDSDDSDDSNDQFDLLNLNDSLNFSSGMDPKDQLDDKYILSINDILLINNVADSIDEKIRSTDYIKFKLGTAININKTIITILLNDNLTPGVKLSLIRKALVNKTSESLKINEMAESNILFCEKFLATEITQSIDMIFDNIYNETENYQYTKECIEHAIKDNLTKQMMIKKEILIKQLETKQLCLSVYVYKITNCFEIDCDDSKKIELLEIATINIY
jgi:hypothetical protein